MNATYTSQVNGKTDPGALNIELDVAAFNFATPIGNAMIRVWGVSLQTISQASDFNGANVKLYAGMAKGLPLANPQQQGLILQGTVFQAFGNWIGTDMTLDLVVVTDGGATQSNPANIVLDWKKGTPLADAIKNTMATAYPDYQVDININQNLVLTQDEPGYFQTVEQFAEYVKQVSLSIIPQNYSGVDITLQGKKFVVYDGTTQTNPKLIAFQDLIGQPTWIDPFSVQANCVLRSDISVGDFIKFPQTQTTTTAQSQSQARDKSTFQGTFQVDMVRHVGNYRQPDGGSWITTFNAHSQPQAAA